MAAVTLSWSGASAAIPARPCTLAGPCTRGRLKLLWRRSVFVCSLQDHKSHLEPGVFSHALDVPGWKENKGKDSLQTHQNCWRRQKWRHSCGQTAQNGEQKTFMTKSLRFVWEQKRITINVSFAFVTISTLVLTLHLTLCRFYDLLVKLVLILLWYVCSLVYSFPYHTFGAEFCW